MKAVVLAAGEGSRLKPLTSTRPKAMIPVGNKPILEYVINAIHAGGIQDVVLVVGYKKEKIMDYFGDGSLRGVNITYVEQFPQLGTAHALRQASHMINDDFLVINGDTVIDSAAIKEIMIYRQGDAVMLTTNVDRADRYGVVDVKDGLVRDIIEKPKKADAGNTVNAGAYRFSPRIFDFLDRIGISERGDYEITDAIRHMIDNGLPVRAVHTGGAWMDAPYPWKLFDMNAATLWARKLEISGRIDPDVHLSGMIGLGKNSIIRAGSYIVGPLSIGDNCDIGPNVVLLPGTSIGSNVTVEPFSRVSDSIVMNHVRVGALSNIYRSVIGEGTIIGPGFSSVSGRSTMDMDGMLMKANMGAIIGDNTTIGARTLIKPGRVVGVRCSIGPGSVVWSNVPDNVHIQ